ncbi:lipoprotein [Legionella dresdenensis]|uniref:Lipoprotein n=1 Tax=Legionella dresdenensis TaxID=450200 RepID=A0ABV8CEG3_9GAMM
MKIILKAVLSGIIYLVITGCGQKGALYLPENTQSTANTTVSQK